MTTLLAIYLIVLSLVLVWIVFRDHRSGLCELLSCRNLALLGLILFQLSSVAYSLLASDYSKYPVNAPAKSGLIFCAMITTFVILSLWAYRRGWFVTTLARRLPTTHASPGDVALLLNAFLITVVAVVMRFGVAIPYISIIAGTVAIGLNAVSSGLVGWVWGRQLRNPVYLVYGLLIIAANLAVVMSFSFGRRGIVAVGGIIVWGMYYSWWRHLRTTGILSRMAIVGLAPVIFLLLFTSVRTAGRSASGIDTSQLTAARQIQNIIQGGSIVRGLTFLASGQYAGAITLFLIENCPENFEYRHMESVYYFFVLPVPRAWWPGKPNPLSQQIARMARISRVNWNRLKLGPGVIGHAAAEGGWYAVALYAIIGGLFFRFFDDIVRLNIDSPFVVLSIGSSMGHFIGLPRGSVPNFAFLAVVTAIGSLLIMVVLGKLAERMSPPAAFADEEPDDADEWEYDEA